MMPRRRPITADLVTHLTDLRTRARNALAEVVEAGPDPAEDLLGAIAWRSSFHEPDPYDNRLREWVELARDLYPWIEIAVACGESADRPGATRTQARQQWRNKLHAIYQLES